MTTLFSILTEKGWSVTCNSQSLEFFFLSVWETKFTNQKMLSRGWRDGSLLFCSLLSVAIKYGPKHNSNNKNLGLEKTYVWIFYHRNRRVNGYTAVAEDPDSVPSSHNRWLATASNYRGASLVFWSRVPHTPPVPINSCGQHINKRMRKCYWLSKGDLKLDINMQCTFGRSCRTETR